MSPQKKTYIQMVKDAIVEMGDSKGSSLAAIKKQIEVVDVDYKNASLLRALKKGISNIHYFFLFIVILKMIWIGIEDEIISKVKGHYKLVSPKKKPAKDEADDDEEEKTPKKAAPKSHKAKPKTASKKATPVASKSKAKKATPKKVGKQAKPKKATPKKAATPKTSTPKSSSPKSSQKSNK